MALYHAGEVVIVRDDLGNGPYAMFDSGTAYGTNDDMRSRRGKPVTITWASRNGYNIKEDNESYRWTDQMFAGLPDFEQEQLSSLYEWAT